MKIKLDLSVVAAVAAVAVVGMNAFCMHFSDALAIFVWSNTLHRRYESSVRYIIFELICNEAHELCEIFLELYVSLLAPNIVKRIFQVCA